MNLTSKWCQEGEEGINLELLRLKLELARARLQKILVLETNVRNYKKGDNLNTKLVVTLKNVYDLFRN